MDNKTKFLSISPVLASANVTRDVEWYENKLGFKNVYDSTRYQDGPMDYAVIAREKLFMHLQFQFPKDMINADIKFQVQNIEPLIEEYLTQGVLNPKHISKKTPWNTYEFSLFDPSGNRLTFLEDL